MVKVDKKSRTRLFTLSKQTFPSHVSEVAYYLRFYWRQYRALLPIIQYNYFLHKLFFRLKEKATLKNFTIFTGKHLCLLKRDSFIRRDSNTGVFLWILQNVLNTTFEESCELLLLRLNLGPHLRVPPYDPTLGSHLRVPPEGPTPGSHLRVLGPTFLVCRYLRGDAFVDDALVPLLFQPLCCFFMYNLSYNSWLRVTCNQVVNQWPQL